MLLFFLFVFGLFVGSFLNVLVDRLPQGESVIKGRSHCEKCKKNLQWFDLIPLLSFVFLKGKCRYCKAKLSFYYPIVELMTGVLFVFTAIFVFNNFQSWISLIYYLFVASSLIAIFFTDLKYGIIPDKIILPTILVSFSYLVINNSSLIINHFLSALGAGLFFLILSSIKIKGRIAMGLGDVKLAFLMGLILGFPNIIVSLYIAFLTGAIVGIILIIWRRKKVFGTTIPFGPFLAVGTLIAIFYGEILTQSFLHLASL